MVRDEKVEEDRMRKVSHTDVCSSLAPRFHLLLCSLVLRAEVHSFQMGTSIVSDVVVKLIVLVFSGVLFLFYFSYVLC